MARFHKDYLSVEDTKINWHELVIGQWKGLLR